VKIETTYRLAAPDRKTGIRAVEKVVMKRDGTHSFVSQAKVVCPTLGEFREAYPNTPVEGAPQAGELALQLGSMSDEQLAEMGLARSDDVDGTVFASPHARTLASELELPTEILTEVGGASGSDGTFTTADVRRIYEHLNG
jgi:hypothetical protein